MNSTEHPAIARIRNNTTGEVRDYPTTISYTNRWEGFPDSKPELDDYIWSEGNFACDCNRGLFFGYAAGLEYEEIPHGCGDGKYSLNLIDQDGNVVYEEWHE
jgi:hypothetical protein